MLPKDRAFTIRLDGVSLQRLLKEADEAGCPPTTLAKRLVVAALQDETKLEILRGVEEGISRVHDALDREFRALRSDLVTSLEAILFELRSTVAGKALCPEERTRFEAKVRTWTEKLRRRG